MDMTENEIKHAMQDKTPDNILHGLFAFGELNLLVSQGFELTVPAFQDYAANVAKSGCFDGRSEEILWEALGQ